MAPSLPSALNIRIAASPSASSGGQIKMTPSAPTEKCRRDSATASAAAFGGSPAARQSR